MTTLNRGVLAELIESVTPTDEAWRVRETKHLNTLTKPPGSLGRLEELAMQMVAIRRRRDALPLSKAVYVFAGDHGVTAEGISAYPSAVTRQMVLNFLAGGAAVNVLARLHGVALHVVDVGVDADFEGTAGLLHHKVAKGTRDMLHEPAMSGEQLMQAFNVGVQLAGEAVSAGHSLLAIGEMGIGNTTSASAITCALTGAPASIATGRGTGLNAEAYRHKVSIVEQVLAKYFIEEIVPSPLDILRCVGGFEIAAMTGMVLAAASHRIAIVADGFISTAAAALAVALQPNVRGYLIAGHRSLEPGHALLLDYLEINPVLSLEMRLGEGSGAVLAMPIVESALALSSQMATFASAGVSEASE